MPLMKSWIESANAADTDFPLNNLPYGVFSVGDEELRCGVAIGDDDPRCHRAGGGGPDRAAGSSGLRRAVLERVHGAWARGLGRLPRPPDSNSCRTGARDAPRSRRIWCRWRRPRCTCRSWCRNTPISTPASTTRTNVGTMFRGADNALPPELAAYPHRLQRARLVGRGLRHAVFTGPWARLKAPDADAPGLRPDQAVRSRAGNGRHRRPALDTGRPHRGRGRRDDLRLRAAQRLVGARYPGLGIPAARPVPGQGDRHHDQPLDRHQRRRWSRSACLRRPRDEARSCPISPNPARCSTTSTWRSRSPPEGERAHRSSRTNYREMYYSAAQQLCPSHASAAAR